jgi:hypothetical protein
LARLPPLLAVTLLDPLFSQYRLIVLSVLLTIVAFLLLQNIWLKGVYESNFLSILESWFLMKLAIMTISAMIMIFIQSDPIGIKIWFTICIAIFICSFIVIVAYHVHLKLAKKTWYNLIMENISHFLVKKKQVIHTSKPKPAPVSRNQPFTHSSLILERQDSVLNLLDPPTDVSYEAYQVDDF